MDFRTQILVKESNVSIDHSTKLMLFGSCFSENIGRKLLEQKFTVDPNPFGILYNPMSIINSIKRLITKKQFTESELVVNNELYHSFMHHSSFSSSQRDICINNISERFKKASNFITNTDVFLITFGTAYAFKHLDTGDIVSNCHKFPAYNFNRFRLTVDEIVDEWCSLIELLRVIQPKVQLVFTVSPIRHFRDGAHENQISKSILLLAIDNLRNRFNDIVDYFPAYEIMIDDLRDYRFYNDDMIHPSQIAQDYIWDLFSEKYFSSITKKINIEWLQIQKSLNHRPIHSGTQSYQKFLKHTQANLNEFRHKYPNINCQDEIKQISFLLETNNI